MSKFGMQETRSQFSGSNRSSRQGGRAQKTQQAGMMIAGQNMTCLPLSEINRMKNSLKDVSKIDRAPMIREKERVRRLNDIRTKNWPDTVKAKKKNKEGKKFNKFKKHEEINRKLDREEQIYKAKLKYAVIGKANKQIFLANDKVKSFQSRMMVSDCLKEREFQVAINKRKEQLLKHLEQQHIDVLHEKLRKFDEKSEKTKQALEKKRKYNMKILHEQHEAMKMKFIKQFQEEKIEGDVIKRQAQEAIELENEKQAKKKAEIIQVLQDTRKANENLQRLRGIEKEKELEEERKIEIYAKQKQAQVDMRKRREEERFREKQASKQRLIDKQVEYLEKLKDEEDIRIDNQIKDAKIKKEKEMALRVEKRRKLKVQMDHFSDIYRQKKKKEKVVQKQKDKEFQQFWNQYNKELQAQEDQEKADIRNRCKDLHQYHKMQARKKQEKIEKMLLLEMKEARKMKFAIEQEDKMFNTWAERCLAEWKDSGKNIAPLMLELTKQRNAHKTLSFA